MILRGRDFSRKELKQIKNIVKQNSDISRRKLSFLVCEQLDWRQPNGSLKDRACRDVLLRLAARWYRRRISPEMRWIKIPEFRGWTIRVH